MLTQTHCSAGEKIDVGSRMKYGSRWYEKGQRKTEEKLLTHIVNTLNSIGKRDAKCAKEMAATNADRGVGQGGRTIMARAAKSKVVTGRSASEKTI